MKIVIIGLLILLGFRTSSVVLVIFNETNGGVSGTVSGFVWADVTNSDEKEYIAI